MLSACGPVRNTTAEATRRRCSSGARARGPGPAAHGARVTGADCHPQGGRRAHRGLQNPKGPGRIHRFPTWRVIAAARHAAADAGRMHSHRYPPLKRAPWLITGCLTGLGRALSDGRNAPRRHGSGVKPVVARRGETRITGTGVTCDARLSQTAPLDCLMADVRPIARQGRPVR